MKHPVHPGRFERAVVSEPLGMSITKAGRVPEVTRGAPSRLVNEKVSLSPEMAIRLDKAFGAIVDTLLRMQASHDIARARQRVGDVLV
jgi:addiction module HigA family antidote